MSTSHPKQEAIHFYADGLKIAGHFTPAVGANLEVAVLLSFVSMAIRVAKKSTCQPTYASLRLQALTP